MRSQLFLSAIVFIITFSITNLYVTLILLSMTELDAFSKGFKEFIKPYNCHLHKQAPTFVCIDPKCQSKGMICSKCLTISGPHKNHDSIDVTQFLEHCLKASSQNDPKRDEMTDLIRRIDEQFQDLLKILTDFHESISTVIKTYISKKNDFHTDKQSYLVIDNLIEQFKTCKFKSIQQMNKTLNILMGRLSAKLEIDSHSQEIMLQKTQFYLDDLTYEAGFIGRELRNIETHLKQLLTVKPSSPVVLAMEPKFNAPKFYENQDIIYIGETKIDRPHGKGLCYYKNSQKIIYGEFKNGQLEGMGELYFSSGDYYIGQFKFDKKDGRGLYQWTGKQSNLYEGEFVKGKRNGRGTFWWADGSWYEGQFRDGVQSGYGVLHRDGGHVEYEGSWHNGMFDGKGTQFFENGEKYEGSFKQDKFHGDGVFYKDDSIIYGVWKDNELSVVNMVKSSLTDK